MCESGQKNNQEIDSHLRHCHIWQIAPITLVESIEPCWNNYVTNKHSNFNPRSTKNFKYIYILYEKCIQINHIAVAQIGSRHNNAAATEDVMDCYYLKY